MVFNATLSYWYIMAFRFIGGGNQSTLQKPHLSQITDKLYHIMYRIHPSGIRTCKLVVIGTDCIGSC